MILEHPSYCNPADRALYAKLFYSSDTDYNKLTEKEKEFCKSMYHMEEFAHGLDGDR